MRMDAYTANDTDDTSSNYSSNLVFEALTRGVEEATPLGNILTRIDIDMAYFSEKLANLDIYLAIVSLGESRLGELSMDVEIEKALIFDLSLAYLESEVTELKRFLNVFQAEIIDAHKELYSLEKRRGTFTAYEEKLHASECSLKHLLEQLSGLERQLAITRGIPYGQKYTFLHEDENSESSGSDMQISVQQGLILKMLDKSLSRGLDLESRLLESKEHVEELKSKLFNTNMVVSDLESFVEVALERALEAEHSSAVYMGISKEMITRLQILQFTVNCSVQREEELKFKLRSSLVKLKEKEIALVDVRNNFAKLEQKVNALEKQLSVSESKLQEVNKSYEASKEERDLLENTVKSLKERVFISETRSRSAEHKLAMLREENIKLKEKFTFPTNTVEKTRLVDKQVRDFEVQLQTAKLSSEATLEQQNMLHMAILDMKTLIEELRSKVSRAESRADSAEKECLGLATTNVNLNKELSNSKSENNKLVESLKQANGIRVVQSKTIHSRVKLISEVIVELASERERIENQLSSFAKENKILLEELQKMRKLGVKVNQDTNVKDSGTVMDVPDVSTVKEIIVETPTSTTASNQFDEPADHTVRKETETASSSTSDVAAELLTNNETENQKNRHVNIKYYTFPAIFVLTLSILAIIVNWQDITSIIT